MIRYPRCLRRGNSFSLGGGAMKAYTKTLKKNMITWLNNLYEEKGSWWQTIVDDKKAFILVRENELHVLIQGALLLKITMDKHGLVCKAHEKHLSSGSGNEQYIKISAEHTDSPYKRIQGEGLTEFVNNYGKIISRITHVHADDRERQYCHTISMNIEEIFEREVGLVLEKSEADKRNKAQFVDLQAVSNDGKMVFVEVKLLSNNEILPLKMPPVVNKHKKYVVTQLKKYEDIIKLHKPEIIKAYTEQYKTYSDLNGEFFKKEFPAPSKIKIFPRVRLIITKFEEAPGRKSLLLRIREGIEKGMGWEENTDNLIMTDNPNEINAGDIFKGIQECQLI
jgi:hypothetical protein